jgi:hypothetical protein
LAVNNLNALNAPIAGSISVIWFFDELVEVRDFSELYLNYLDVFIEHFSEFKLPNETVDV